MIVLAINIDKAFFLSDMCIANRAKDLIFWSIQKASYALSSYGAELVTQELFQAVYSLISDQSQRVLPCGLGAIDPKSSSHMI